MEIRRTDQGIIGELPDRETYEVHEGPGKLMELSFFENSDTFEIYIQNIDGGTKMPGETTELFKVMLKKMQHKANELGRPITLSLDPVVPIVKDWARIKGAEVVGGWDSISSTEDKFIKMIHPKASHNQAG